MFTNYFSSLFKLTDHVSYPTLVLEITYRSKIGNHFKRILEVEPLSFVCCAESGNLQTRNIIDDILLKTPSHNTVKAVHMRT